MKMRRRNRNEAFATLRPVATNIINTTKLVKPRSRLVMWNSNVIGNVALVQSCKYNKNKSVGGIIAPALWKKCIRIAEKLCTHSAKILSA